ncbi:MAG: MurR/RpiR family transcriptional regulator [Pseudomonadota bacterium]
MTEETVEARIGAKYAGLSARLRSAADYLAAHPVELATRSLRALAQSSGVSPATFSRLARALGYADYEALREAGRQAVGRKVVPFSERAQQLQRRGDGRPRVDLLDQQVRACGANIAYLGQNLSAAQLNAAVTALHAAPTVMLIAAMGSAGILDYFGYQAQWFRSNWVVAGRDGMSTAATLSRMQPGDAVLGLVKAPYAQHSMATLEAARRKGLSTIVLTDAHASPALTYADHSFVLPTDSANFFSSYAATLVLLEAMISMLLQRAGPTAEQRIRDTEELTSRLGENWPERRD